MNCPAKSPLPVPLHGEVDARWNPSLLKAGSSVKLPTQLERVPAGNGEMQLLYQ